MGALGLHDRVEADAGVGQGAADGRGGAGAIGQAPHCHLGLIAVEGNAANSRIPLMAGPGIAAQLLIRQLKGFGGGPQGPIRLVSSHQAAHLHLAGSNQAQVDA